MADEPAKGGGNDRSVHIGGKVTGSGIATGDRNVVTTTYTRTTLPPAESIDIKAELEALRGLLADLKTDDRRKIDNALAEAVGDAEKAQPPKDEIGRAVERVLDYAGKAENFADKVDKLIPHVKAVAAWLGDNGYRLLGAVGLTL